jgi:diguanylate cyclase (GGDEF)-like protein
VTAPGAKVKYTISIGLTVLQESDTSINQALQRADEALYQAKGSGRNRIVIAPDA